jgi:dynamin family protein
MNIVEILKKYRDVAAFLSDDANRAVLDNLITCMEGKQYYLPFIGQFSAGKSKLINRLIGKEILPTKSVETTAFLTYISYADTESAILEYVDGTKEAIDISKIKELDHQRTCEGKAIAALRYMAPIDLLKSGLIIVDTPGVNTLINEHVKMTEGLLQNSQFIVYVSASSLTDSDKRMIKKIDELGIEMVFVRTHIDEIHESEEDATTTIQTEISAIQSALGKEIVYYTLCNESKSSEFERWIQQYENFKEYISLCLASSVDEIYTLSTISRLTVLKGKFEKALNSKLAFVKQNSEKSNSEITEMIAELSKQKKSINSKLDVQSDKIKVSTNTISSKLQNELQSLKKKQVSAFNEKVEANQDADDLLNKAKKLFEKSLPVAVEELNNYASSGVYDWKEGVLADIQKDIQEVNMALQPLHIDFDTDFDESSIMAYEQMFETNQSDIAEKYYQLKTLNEGSDEELSVYGIERQKIEELLQQYDTEITQGNQKIQEMLDNYVPQHVESGGKLGKILKKFGTIGDIAMLLIPAAGWQKAGTMLAQKAGTLAKSGSMLAKTGSNVLKQLSEGAKAMSKADTVLDMTKLISYAQGGKPIQTQSTEKKKTGIFDYLSLSYWFEKAGNAIDPVTYIEDEKYKAEYNRAVNQIQAEVNLQVQQKVALLKKMRKLTEEEEIKRLEIEERAKEEKSMQQRLEQEKLKLEQQRKNSIKTKIVEDTQQQFNEKLSDYTKVLIARVKEEIDRVSTNITEAMLSFVNTQIEEVEAKLKEILEKRSHTEYDQNKEQEDILNQLTKLEIPNE